MTDDETKKMIESLQKDIQSRGFNPEDVEKIMALINKPADDSSPPTDPVATTRTNEEIKTLKEKVERLETEKKQAKRKELEKELTPTELKDNKDLTNRELELFLKGKRQIGVKPEPDTDTSETGYPYMVWDETLGKNVWKRK